MAKCLAQQQRISLAVKMENAERGEQECKIENEGGTQNKLSAGRVRTKPTPLATRTTPKPVIKNKKAAYKKHSTQKQRERKTH